MKTKSVADIQKKWGEVTPQRQAYYEAGAENAGDDWEKNATAAAMAYKSAVSAGNIENMFKGGIKKAGASKYNRKVKEVGAARFSQGVQAAVSDYGQGVQPYIDTLAGMQLPARAPRGSDANLQRVREVASKLHMKRLALRASGA